jgi:hypothetical protein
LARHPHRIDGAVQLRCQFLQGERRAARLDGEARSRAALRCARPPTRRS